MTPVPPVVPMLRGWFHLVCFFLALPAGAAVIVAADSTAARFGAVIYALGLAALFGVSGTYHRGHWSPKARGRMKRADHATIFVMIAASYTPICIVALDGALRVGMLVAAWVGGIGGLVLAVTGIAERRILGLVCYIALGWVAVVALPALYRRMSAVQLLLLVAGGVVYTVGGIVLGTHRPDPWPRVFGYHEVWHVMVIAAATCHYALIFSLVIG